MVQPYQGVQQQYAINTPYQGPVQMPAPGSAPVGTSSSGPAAPSGSVAGPVPPPPTVNENIVVRDSRDKGAGIHPDLVVGFGALLMIVNGFTSGQFSRIVKVVTGGSNKADSDAAHKDFLVLGGEAVFIIALDMIAKTDDSANTMILVLLFGLWTVWSIQNVSVITNFVKKVTP